MTDRELMQHALEALQYASDQTKPENLHGCDCLLCTTILALRDKLAQPETPDVTPEVTPYVIDCPRCGHCCPQPNQEPVKDNLDFWDLFDETQRLRAELKFNTTPQQRQWVGLTLLDMAELRRSGLHEISDKHFQAIEAKLREKNSG